MLIKNQQDQLASFISSYFTSLLCLRAFGKFAAILKRQEKLQSAITSGEILCNAALQSVSKDGSPYFGLHIRTLNLCNGKYENIANYTSAYMHSTSIIQRKES